MLIGGMEGAGERLRERVKEGEGEEIVRMRENIVREARTTRFYRIAFWFFVADVAPLKKRRMSLGSSRAMRYRVELLFPSVP